MRQVRLWFSIVALGGFFAAPGRPDLLTTSTKILAYGAANQVMTFCNPDSDVADRYGPTYSGSAPATTTFNSTSNRYRYPPAAP